MRPAKKLNASKYRYETRSGEFVVVDEARIKRSLRRLGLQLKNLPSASRLLLERSQVTQHVLEKSFGLWNLPLSPKTSAPVSNTLLTLSDGTYAVMERQTDGGLLISAVSVQDEEEPS